MLHEARFQRPGHSSLRGLPRAPYNRGMLRALLFLGPIGPMEIMIVLGIGLLLFGARLPEVGRSLGRSLLEFKKGLKGLQDDVTGLDREADRMMDAELERRRLDARSRSPRLDQPAAWDARPEEQAAHAPPGPDAERADEPSPAEPDAERADEPSPPETDAERADEPSPAEPEARAPRQDAPGAGPTPS